ncbi:Methyltransferase domain-containing protein [Klenkia soli]|uniref:Methyltransferase domain-containing protein n=1 Tax=Klenkia soli TaxID=1052260 RepID=A0A1H0ECM9_9ACTN|nr:class I SAM-dependent methyltransferase [Klenkia soli]SDN80122.1 Methyltransferase domain-containing protein [Klenkia soli]
MARYDGHADWYDAWWTGAGAGAMAAAGEVLAELLPDRVGTALDVGCGTGRQVAVLADRAERVVGVDLSADQLRHARGRLPVALADATALPVTDGGVDLVATVLTHTDVPDLPGLVREAARVLRPGGRFVLVGVHPCFVHPFAEPREDGVLVRPGYARSGWAERTAHTGDAVRARVGVHHRTLADLPEFLGLALDRTRSR